jgi:hypothetical protein
LPEDTLVGTPSYTDLERHINRIADEAEMSSFPRCDNVSLVGLRWLSAESIRKNHREKSQHGDSRTPTDETGERDPLQQAIDDIHRAMLDYAAEMKK